MRFADEVVAVVATEQLCSLPIPAQESGQLKATAFYYGRHFFPKTAEADLYPPTFLGRFDWESGDCEWISSTEPDHLGLADSRFQVVERINYRQIDEDARAKGLGGAVERGETINSLLDELLPIWLDGRKPVPILAERLGIILPTVLPKVYRPVYLSLGREFVQWLGLGNFII